MLQEAWQLLQHLPPHDQLLLPQLAPAERDGSSTGVPSAAAGTVRQPPSVHELDTALGYEGPEEYKAK